MFDFGLKFDSFTVLKMTYTYLNLDFLNLIWKKNKLWFLNQNVETNKIKVLSFSLVI
jgi:hypothetical protein